MVRENKSIFWDQDKKFIKVVGESGVQIGLFREGDTIRCDEKMNGDYEFVISVVSHNSRWEVGIPCKDKAEADKLLGNLNRCFKTGKSFIVKNR